jgi:hypothetical protein
VAFKQQWHSALALAGSARQAVTSVDPTDQLSFMPHFAFLRRAPALIRKLRVPGFG